MLWTFNDESFIPHAIASAEINADLTPVVISHDQSASNSLGTMINLATNPPLNPADFERIAEIVNQEPQRKQSGRQHYKMYQDLGCELHHHEID